MTNCVMRQIAHLHALPKSAAPAGFAVPNSIICASVVHFLAALSAHESLYPHSATEASHV
jgi:hypothetical protein